MGFWTTEHLRHAVALVKRGPNPAATVYDSIGTEFFLALAPGWLNLGLWDGTGDDEAEAPVAAQRLVRRLAGELPRGGGVLDVGNGLGEQDPLIARVAETRRLIALNITMSQLRAGRARLGEAGAWPVNGDAVRIPLADESVDGVISVEAAFHFASRARFFAEALRVLRPGGVLTMSDIPTSRRPRTPGELVAGVTLLRLWGLNAQASATSDRIVALARNAGFVDVRTELVGVRTIAPALRFARARLDRSRGEVPRTYEVACGLLLRQVELLWRRGLLDYLLLRARRPSAV
jgi:SAM-dependent methyltransferase